MPKPRLLAAAVGFASFDANKTNRFYIKTTKKSEVGTNVKYQLYMVGTYTAGITGTGHVGMFGTTTILVPVPELG